jgi:hypothetical protein
MGEYFTSLAQPSQFYPLSDPVLIDASGVPQYWLPEEFSRVTYAGETRLAFGKNLLTPATTAHVHACIKTTAIAGTEYYMDNDGYALVIPRSCTDPAGISYEHKRIKFTKGDDQQADLLNLIAKLLIGYTPPAPKALYVVGALRDIHRARNSKAVLSVLNVPPGSTFPNHLATLLESSERHVPALASNLLSCMMTEELLSSSVLCEGRPGSQW